MASRFSDAQPTVCGPAEDSRDDNFRAYSELLILAELKVFSRVQIKLLQFV